MNARQSKVKRTGWRRFWKISSIVLAVVFVVGYLGLWYISAFPAIPPYQAIEQTVYLNEVEGACKAEPRENDHIAGMPLAAFDKTTRNPDSSYQGWCEEYRQNYYRRPQGTTFFGLRWDWVGNLERPVGRKRLASREYLQSIGFIYDGALLPNVENPYDLPIGVTWHKDDNGHKILDFTCAACHSSQFTYQGKAVQIDGGSGGHSLTSVSPSQFIAFNMASLFTTLVNPVKFDRFAEKVLARTPEEERPAARREMHSAMWDTIGEVLEYFWFNYIWPSPGAFYPTAEGYGRTDGLGRIVNTVFADYLDHSNYRVADAPVNYPHLWDIWGFDWVQWMGSVNQPMARNVNESLGVRARLELRDPDKLFESSAMLPEMHCIEMSLQHLLPPTWPEKLFGTINTELSAEGEVLFNDVCLDCHGPFRVKVDKAGGDPIGYNKPTCQTCHGPWMKSPESKGKDRHDNMYQTEQVAHTDSKFNLQEKRTEYWKMLHIHLDYIGTDPTSALNFINNTYDLSALKDSEGGKAVTLDPTKPKPKPKPKPKDELRYIDDWEHVKGAMGLRFIGGEVRFKNYDTMGIFNYESREAVKEYAINDLNGFGELDRPDAFKAYRPRPLQGIWATAPYLHNGSVPTLYQLLLPADERDAQFYLGRKEYDPIKVGIRTDKFPNAFKFDTGIKGNSNLGHEFDDGLCGNGVIGFQIKEKPGYCRQFSERERMALLEYIKVHKDDPRMDPGTAAHCSNASWPGKL